MFYLSLFQVEKFVFVLVRVSAIFIAAPVFNSRSIPVQLKVGLALFLTIAMLPSAQVAASSFSGGLPFLAVGLVSEVLVGAAIGLMARLMMTTVQAMGQLVGFQMGFGIARAIDPSTADQGGILAAFLSIFGILIFLATDSHHLFFRALAESFRVLAPFTFSVSPAFTETLARTLQNVFVIALKMGAPLIAILLFIYTAFGIIARTVPRINLLIAGFPVTIGVGLLAFGVALPHTAKLIREVFGQLGHDVLILLGGT